MTLRQHLREHYETKHPTPGRLAELHALVHDADAGRGRRRRMLFLVAAAAVAAVGLTLFLRRGPDVAEEIARNHRKAQEPVLACTSFGHVRDQLSRLDFEVIEPALLQEGGYTLIGARYCSLQGRIAAQLRLVSESGRPCTLYQIRDLRSVAAGESVVDGVRVRIWRERGLLLGLARE